MFFESVHISRAFNTGTCIQQGDIILFCGPTQVPVLATVNTGKTWERFGKNADEWTGRVEISKEEMPGSKLSMFGYLLTYSRL